MVETNSKTNNTTTTTLEHIPSDSSLAEDISLNASFTERPSNVHLLNLHKNSDDKIDLAYSTHSGSSNSLAESSKIYSKKGGNDFCRTYTREVAVSLQEEEREGEEVTATTNVSSDTTISGNLVNEKEDEEDSGFVSGDDDPYEYPEGGLRAWIVVFGCFCGFVACFGILNVISVIENYISDHQLSNESSSSIGWIFSLMLFMCFGSCIISGTYFDRNGFFLPVFVGTIMHVGGLLAAAQSTKIWHFILALSLVCGFGNGLLLSPLMSAPAHYFKKKRGTATAFSTVGGSIGGALFPLMLRKFYAMKRAGSPYFGYIWGMRAVALIDLALLVIAMALSKERLPHVTEPMKEGEPRWRYILRVYFLQSLDITAFKDLRYLFCVIGTVFGELAFSNLITYYSSYAMAWGISQGNAYLLVMVFNLVGIPGRWIPGYLSDHLGRFNVSITTLIALAIIMFVGYLPFGKNLTNFYVLTILFGFFSGTIFSLLPVCCGQISKTEEFGRRYSTMYFVVSFGNLIGVPIGGAIIGNKSQADYRHFLIFSGVIFLCSAAGFIVSRGFSIGYGLKRF